MLEYYYFQLAFSILSSTVSFLSITIVEIILKFRRKNSKRKIVHETGTFLLLKIDIGRSNAYETHLNCQCEF